MRNRDGGRPDGIQPSRRPASAPAPGPDHPLCGVRAGGMVEDHEPGRILECILATLFADDLVLFVRKTL